MSMTSLVDRVTDYLKNGSLKKSFKMDDGRTMLPCVREVGSSTYKVHTEAKAPVVLPDGTEVHFSHGMLTQAKKPDDTKVSFDLPDYGFTSDCELSTLLHIMSQYWDRMEHPDGSVSVANLHDHFCTRTYPDGTHELRDMLGNLTSRPYDAEGRKRAAVERPDGSKEWWHDGQLLAAQDGKGLRVTYRFRGGYQHRTPEGLKIEFDKYDNILHVLYPSGEKDIYVSGKPDKRVNKDGDTIITFDAEGQGYSCPTPAERENAMAAVAEQSKKFVTAIANAVMDRVLPAEVLTLPTEAAQGIFHSESTLPKLPTLEEGIDAARTQARAFAEQLDTLEARTASVFNYVVQNPEANLPAAHAPFIAGLAGTVRTMQTTAQDRLAPRFVGPYVMQSPLKALVAA